MFGISRTRPTEAAVLRMEAVARTRGALLIEAILPGTGYQRWFCIDGLDRARAVALQEDLVEAGILERTIIGYRLAARHAHR